MVDSFSGPLLPRDPNLPGPHGTNEQMYRVLVETSHDLIWSVDAQGRWTFLNHAAQRCYGYEPQEMLGRTFMEFETAEQAQRDLEVFAQIKAGTPYFNYETQHLRKDGTPVWLSFNAVVWRDAAGNVVGTTGTARDITDRRHSEDALRLVEAALESVADALFITSRDGVIRYVNPAFTALTGYTAAEAIGQKPSLVCSGMHDTAFYERLWQTILGDNVWRGQITNRHKDGRLFVSQQTISPVRDASGEVTHFVSIQQDVTERKKVEEELRWRTTLLEAQIDSALDGILVVDRAGRKILQNQRLVELWKIPRAIAEDKDDSRQVAYCTGRTKNPRQFADKVGHLYAHPDEISRDEVELVDGTILDRYSSPVRDKAGNHYGRIWTFRDLTEQRRLEEQLRQSQKMESIGQLAGGVAHDFNNILTIIFGHLALIERQETTVKVDPGSLDEIKQAADRAANLTRQLLTFSRRQSMHRIQLDFNAVVSNMARLLQRLLGEDIAMDVRLGPDPLVVRGDPGMLDQVLLNLAVNSRDAMPRGGSLVIQTSAVTFDETVTTHMPLGRTGEFVCLAVSDTGAGIPPPMLPRVFEPFFTTKGVGKGTGLGLATVYGIVQQHEGWIVAESAPGRGTTFSVYLPRQSSSLLAESPVRGTSVAAPAGHETILLVEDDASLRALTSSLLRRLGYRVLAAGTGPQALELWREHGRDIRILVTDLVLPDGISGFDLGAQCIREAPGLRVIYVSGYSPEIAGRHDELVPGVNFLAKPFDIDSLARAIRARLDQPAD